MKQTISAIDGLLAGLIDHAGLYPPAGLDMRSAVRNYFGYRQSPHAAALGRFIVDLDRIDELGSIAGENLREMKLSVIATPGEDWRRVSAFVDRGVPIESIEVKVQSISEIEVVSSQAPPNLERYFELAPASMEPEILRFIAARRARVKLRMGGVVAVAIPSTATVAGAIMSIARHGLAFKATAGLHHPIRSRHPLSYAPDSPTEVMHGFVNLLCGVAMVHSGGTAEGAEAVLDEEDPGAFRVTPQAISWRSHDWGADDLSETRSKLVSFGSCSFEEPIRDLEALGWL